MELIEEGEPAAVPAGVDVAAYRVVQEALTNALRHAGAVPTRVHLRRDRSGLELCVTNAAGATGAPGGGHCLVGMRERVRIYGGSVKAGPEPGGLPGAGVAAAGGWGLVNAVITVLVADDHALVRNGLRAMLGLHEDLEVVGRLPTGWRRWSWPPACARTWW